MERISKENYYLNIAQTVLERATCLRRVYGAIIVKNDEIISTGYNGAPRGRRNCVDMGLLHPRGHAGAPGRAVRAVPQRPRRGQRHHLRRPAGHGGRHAVSGGPGCPDRRAASRCHLLRHVPPTRHQRRDSPRWSSAIRRRSSPPWTCRTGCDLEDDVPDLR